MRQDEQIQLIPVQPKLSKTEANRRELEPNFTKLSNIKISSNYHSLRYILVWRQLCETCPCSHAINRNTGPTITRQWQGPLPLARRKPVCLCSRHNTCPVVSSGQEESRVSSGKPTKRIAKSRFQPSQDFNTIQREQRGGPRRLKTFNGKSQPPQTAAVLI